MSISVCRTMLAPRLRRTPVNVLWQSIFSYNTVHIVCELTHSEENGIRVEWKPRRFLFELHVKSMKELKWIAAECCREVILYHTFYFYICVLWESCMFAQHNPMGRFSCLASCKCPSASWGFGCSYLPIHYVCYLMITIGGRHEEEG